MTSIESEAILNNPQNPIKVDLVGRVESNKYARETAEILSSISAEMNKNLPDLKAIEDLKSKYISSLNEMESLGLMSHDLFLSSVGDLHLHVGQIVEARNFYNMTVDHIENRDGATKEELELLERCKRMLNNLTIN